MHVGRPTPTRRLAQHTHPVPVSVVRVPRERVLPRQPVARGARRDARPAPTPAARQPDGSTSSTDKTPVGLHGHRPHQQRFAHVHQREGSHSSQRNAVPPIRTRDGPHGGTNVWRKGAGPRRCAHASPADRARCTRRAGGPRTSARHRRRGAAQRPRAHRRPGRSRRTRRAPVRRADRLRRPRRRAVAEHAAPRDHRAGLLGPAVRRARPGPRARGLADLRPDPVALPRPPG